MHRLTTLCLLLLGGLLFSACSDHPEWVKIRFPAFSFSLPPSFKENGARGVDSFVREYTAGSMTLAFDYGRFSDDFSHWPDNTRFEDLQIRGTPARIGVRSYESAGRTSYLTMIHLRSNPHSSLSVTAQCNSEEEVALARQIFLTIVFHDPKAK